MTNGGPGRAALVLVAAALVACSDTDGASDLDAADDGAVADGATETLSDARPDASAEGSADAGADAGGDVSVDAGVDTAATDAGDAGGDAKPSSGCGKTGAATGDLTLTTTDGKGVKRDFEVLVPASYTGTKPLALVFAYHGAGGDSSSAKAYGIQSAAGAANESIFVFPKGIPFGSFGVGWDDGCKGYDMVFFDRMLAAITSAYCIDERAVFAAGFSWGCDHVTALTCCRGDKLRAVAAASCSDEFGNVADSTTYSNAPCPAPTGGTAIRFTHDVVGDGGYTTAMFTTTSKLYRSWAGCGATSTKTSPSPCVSWNGCGRPVVECAYTGLGHATPSGFGADTWAFFSAVR
ncbi:MAG: hypothetical protein JSR82_11825 [Verrucomicrobia bacterium]|nr:hypothetical protein [Verrucomicrobiota bacterium]